MLNTIKKIAKPNSCKIIPNVDYYEFDQAMISKKSSNKKCRPKQPAPTKHYIVDYKEYCKLHKLL
jgi:hypothetical protein